MKKQITFPIVIKKKGVPFTEPINKSLYYILAADGWYQVRKTKMYETCIKVDHDVPGYEPQKEYCRSNLPLLPNKLMDEVMSFFRTVNDDLVGEAIVELFLNEETGEWLAIPPYQAIPETTYSTYVNGEWQYGMKYKGSPTPKEYGHEFEKHVELLEAPRGWERWDNKLQKYVPAKQGDKGAVRKPRKFTTGWHDLLYKPTTSAEWPEGFVRMGTIHSHPTADAYFSTTDDMDDKYGDGLHLVFGRINSKVKIDDHVKASFCSNGQRFEWMKKENDEVCEHFINPDAPFPIEWLKKCHEVTHVGNKYVSVKFKKAKAASQPKPVKGPRAAPKSNVRPLKGQKGTA